MTERRAPRSPAQGQIDTTALQVAERVAGLLEGHTELDSERFGNLQNDVAELKTDIKQLNTDAKQAIQALDTKQEGYHRTNTDALGKLTSALAELTNRQAGAQGVGAVVLKLLPLIMMGATLALTIWWHR